MSEAMSDAGLVRALSRAGDLRAPDALRGRLRSELLAAPVTFARPRARFAFWRAALATAVALAVALGGTGAAAASSLPGDPAFAIKRGFEDLQLAFAPDDVTRATLAVAIADRRLADLEAVASRPDRVGLATAAHADALERVRSLADALGKGAATPARDAALDLAAAAAARHLEVLERLADRLPGPAQPGIERAREASDGAKEAREKTPRSPVDPAKQSADPAAPAGAPAKPEKTEKPRSDDPGKGGPPSPPPGRGR